MSPEKVRAIPLHLDPRRKNLVTPGEQEVKDRTAWGIIGASKHLGLYVEREEGQPPHAAQPGKCRALDERAAASIIGEPPKWVRLGVVPGRKKVQKTLDKVLAIYYYCISWVKQLTPSLSSRPTRDYLSHGKGVFFESFG